MVVTKGLYYPGDAVQGELAVQSDKEFKYNAIHVTFTGREHTRIVVSSGKSTVTYTDERMYFSNRQDMAREGVIPEGETRFPFSFMLPNEVPCSYSGRCAWIQYALKGVVEISRALDLKQEISLIVRRQTSEPAPQPVGEEADKEGLPEFEAQMDGDCACLGDSIGLRYKVAADVKIRGVRAELKTEEYAIAKRIKRKTRWTLAEESTQDHEIDRDQWMELQLKTDDSMPVSYEGEIVTNRAFVKLTLDIPWVRDKVIELPVRLGYYARAPDADQKKTSEFHWSVG
jgi:hypothetical protein